MKTVIDNINIIIIKNSKFITLLYQVEKENSVNELLKLAKKNYPKATHYCYAYIIDNLIKSSDDGEPNGTASNPILNILQKENINHVLCIVIRYFGGIKLGSAGLIRAYSKCTKDCLKIIELKKGYLIELNFNYNNIKYIDFLLKNINIINKDFKGNITYKLKITIDDYTNIINDLKEKSVIKIIKEIYL